jgi:hypothetical protein
MLPEPGTPACTDQLTELFERWLSEWESDDSRLALIVSPCVARSRHQQPGTELRLRFDEERVLIADGRAMHAIAPARSVWRPPLKDVRRIGRW